MSKRQGYRSALVVVVGVVVAGAFALVFAASSDDRAPERLPGSAAPVVPDLAQLWIDQDGGSCRRRHTPDAHRPRAACGSFGDAYDAARQGDLVLVKAGTYMDAELTGEVKGDPDADEPDVTFRAAEGETVRLHDVEVLVPHITFRDIDLLEAGFKYRSDYEAQRAGDITVINSDGHSMTVSSVWNFTVKNSDIGPNRHPGQRGDETQDGVFVGAYPVDDGHHPTHLTFAGVTFHDALRPFDAAHSDCLQLTAGEDVRIVRSRFYRCADAAIIPKNDQGPIADLLIERNEINEVLNASEEINFFDTGRPCGRVVIRDNSVVGTIRVDAGEPRTDCDLVVTGNLAASMSESRCDQSQARVLDANVWETGVACGEANRVLPGGDSGFVDRSNGRAMDLRLKADSEAAALGVGAHAPR
jgi:hypothetical protein